MTNPTPTPAAKAPRKAPAPNTDGIKYADEFLDAEVGPSTSTAPAAPAPRAIPPTEEITRAYAASTEAPPPEPPPAVMTIERNRANQEAAARVIANMKHVDASHAPIRAKPLPVPTAEEAAKMRAKLFRVRNERRISKGAASYVLKAGKVISQNEYDVASLRLQGVELDEIDV